MSDETRAMRQRLCAARDCRTPFWICRPCDRGHRYCSQNCRENERVLQRREANRRHQRSPEGRLDHRDRQRAYRERLRARVTDQGRRRAACSVSIHARIAAFPIPGKTAGPRREWRYDQGFHGSGPASGPVCVRCGRPGRHVDPFHWG